MSTKMISGGHQGRTAALSAGRRPGRIDRNAAQRVHRQASTSPAPGTATTAGPLGGGDMRTSIQ